jgi:Tfp pilus assembly pilus retraction ATPase PilT
MNKQILNSRLAIFPEMMHTHDESECINRIVRDFRYNNKDLLHIMYKIMLQNSKSNDLSPEDEYYNKWLNSL